MKGIYNLGLEKFLSSLGMRGFVGVWRPLTCGNRPVPNRNLDLIRVSPGLHCGNVETVIPPARDVKVRSRNNLVYGYYSMLCM